MARPQGRRPSDWRKIITEIENLDRVDASARFGFGWLLIGPEDWCLMACNVII